MVCEWLSLQQVFDDMTMMMMMTANCVSVCFQGTIVVQPEDATDSPFQGPEFFPIGSVTSG